MVAKIVRDGRENKLDVREHQVFTSKKYIFWQEISCFVTSGTSPHLVMRSENFFFVDPWRSALKIPDGLILLELMSR